MTMETIAVRITDVFEVMRLAEFAADVLELADERVDPELRDLIDDLRADLLMLRAADDEGARGDRHVLVDRIGDHIPELHPAETRSSGPPPTMARSRAAGRRAFAPASRNDREAASLRGACAFYELVFEHPLERGEVGVHASRDSARRERSKRACDPW